ncbi:hypothetical protein N5K55_03470 (plasmid) [Pseudomonas aeruginosa]|nr:hypothetical protein [Pseudomonas aeruginosa]
MNHKLKIGLAFVAGALISNAGTVMSNVPNGQDDPRGSLVFGAG